MHFGRQKPQVDVQHHKYLVESSQLELKLERLRLNDRLYNLGNKSFKTTSDKFSKGLSYKHKNVRRSKNTLKDFEVSSRTESLVHHHSAPKSKKNFLPKPQFSNFNIMSNNIRGLVSKKASLEDILETNNVDICCVQEVNNKNPPRFKDYVQFNRFSKLRMHGVMMLVHNSLRQHVIRIPDESELECVHVRLNHTTPALNIIGLYLDVESRSTLDAVVARKKMKPL